jgi:hypothetical protein
MARRPLGIYVLGIGSISVIAVDFKHDDAGRPAFGLAFSYLQIEVIIATVAAEPGLEVLFLNPLREDDDFSLGLNSDATRRLIIIDDAHRAEQVPVALLGMVQRDEKTKLILASRPQGQEAIISRLYEVGIGAASTYPMALPPFKKNEARLLAKAILGDNFQQHLEPFIKLTEGNPFLVATAGNLLRENLLKWGAWGQDKDFRRHVFQIFETENLKFANIPDAERLHASRLLRLLAILSPVEIDADFLERAGKLIPGVVSMERLIQFLKLVELVVGPEAGLRVSPDLFADFLVYETCFAPENREPVWTAQVLDLFEDHTATLIRNFSEASWIAHLNGVDGEAVLGHVLVWSLSRHAGLESHAALVQRKLGLLQPLYRDKPPGLFCSRHRHLVYLGWAKRYEGAFSAPASPKDKSPGRRHRRRRYESR